MDTTAPPRPNFSLALLLLLCTAGLLIAIKLGGLGGEAVCRSSGCQQVLTSGYSHVHGWPIASFGVGFYSVMILLWCGFVSVERGRLRRALLYIALLLSLCAGLISIVLVCLQFFMIGPVCPFCLISSGICVVLGRVTYNLCVRSDWSPQFVAGVAGLTLLGVIGFRSISPSNSVVAQIGQQIITRVEMENSLGATGRRAEWEIYRTEKNWLDQKITDILVQREAAARHISPAQLVQDEFENPVNQKLDDFLKKNAAKLKPEDRAIVREQMRIRFKSDRAAQFVAQLKRKYGVVEYLTPPAINESDLENLPGPHRGGDAHTAPIRLVIFSDFGCDYCAHTSQAIAAAMKQYGNKISLTFHYLPLDIHYRSQAAAIAAECAAEQDKFWPFHDALMSHGGALSGVDFLKLAGEVGLDQNKFRECLSSSAAGDVVNESTQQANLLGIDATPAVFLNGQRIGGDLSEAALLDWIERIAAVPRSHQR